MRWNVRNIVRAMKKLLPWLLVLFAAAAAAQEGRGRPQGPGPRWQPAMKQPAAPGPGMSREERQRLRDELKSPRPDGSRQPPPPMPPEQRERLLRDLRDANRDLGRRR